MERPWPIPTAKLLAFKPKYKYAGIIILETYFKNPVFGGHNGNNNQSVVHPVAKST
jgi:hypothetical protein